MIGDEVRALKLIIEYFTKLSIYLRQIERTNKTIIADR